MSDDQKTDRNGEPKKPDEAICPYCEADPMELALQHLPENGAVILLASCRSCRKLVPVQLLRPPRPDGRIVTPNR